MNWEIVPQSAGFENYLPRDLHDSSSTTGQHPTANLLEEMLSSWSDVPKRRFMPFAGLSGSFLIVVDTSTMFPHLEFSNETFPTIRRPLEEDLLLGQEMLQHDLVVRIPPKETYEILVDIKTIEKGVPKVVEPEGY